jgi:VWFA-related protein
MPVVASLDMPTVLGSLGKPTAAAPAKADEDYTVVDAHNRRLIVLFFDLSSMQPEEVQRAVTAARDYVDNKITPADILAVVSLGTSLRIAQDFTTNRDLLKAAINRLSPLESAGFEEGATADAAAASEDAFTPDDTEFNLFNTDQRLESLRRIADTLASIPQKKSLVYFSSGMSQMGLDNEIQLRRVVDRAVRANVSIYTADMRGLEAQVPGGGASSASVRGTSAFSGRAVQGQFDRAAASQDSLSSLAEDTGGQAFFDANEFGAVFDRVVADTTTYYLIGYSSTNGAQDGRFRRIRVTAKRPDVKLEYRVGYYARRDFAHSGKDDREQQLQEQIESDLSVTDLPIHGSAAYFRLKEDRFFVPVWLVIPGSSIPFARSSQQERATLDVLGVIRDRQRRPVAWIRDTVKLNVDADKNVRQKSVQYQTSFELPPGQYLLKTVIRENQEGTLGSYEAVLTVPRLPATGMKLSTVVFGTQLQRTPSNRNNKNNPLVRDGQELVASITNVASGAQQLYFYFEVYDPAPRPAAAGTRPGTSPAGEVRVLASVSFFKGKQRVYQTPMAEVVQISDTDRKTVIVKLDVPASALEPGLYTCQINVVDDVAGTFAFPRLALYLRK